MVDTKYFNLDTESYIVSIPRSGQGITWGFLIKLYEHYYGNLNHNNPEEYKQFAVCDYHKCCMKVPCKWGKSVQKNHDFDLKTIEICPSKKYLVLYRKDYILSLEACFRFKYRNVVSDFDYKKNKVLLLSLIRFIINNRNKYYNVFVRKYGLDKIVENDLNSNICAFDYYDLIDKPYDTLTFIAKFFFGNKFSDTQLDSFISDYQNRIKIRNSLDNGIYQYIKKELNIFYSRGQS